MLPTTNYSNRISVLHVWFLGPRHNCRFTFYPLGYATLRQTVVSHGPLNGDATSGLIGCRLLRRRQCHNGSVFTLGHCVATFLYKTNTPKTIAIPRQGRRLGRTRAAQVLSDANGVTATSAGKTTGGSLG